MSHWEYNVATCRFDSKVKGWRLETPDGEFDSLDNALAAIGRQGWGLAAIQQTFHPSGGGATTWEPVFSFYVFKRPKQ
jgi:hypothetical protein